ncbi:MAG: carotenoid oxygenase family protein [Rhizobacter sp.]|nr:carotenoid oxygenase family protein [Rhizobacter sp.]
MNDSTREATTSTAKRSRLRGFDSGAREIDEASLLVEGDLPAWLRGALLLNGPALWELPNGKLQHWFDGYAMQHRLRFDGAGVRYRSRFVQSDSYRRSTTAGAPAYGEFGSDNPASLWSRLRGPQATDNPAVVMAPHGERWLAVTETPHLTYFDPDTLATQERLDLATPALPMHLMAAHGFTLADGNYLNVGTQLGPKCRQTLFRLPPGATQPVRLGEIAMPKAGYTHAFALAAGHAIVWECALRTQPLSFRFSAKSFKDNFRWEPEGGSSIHALPLAGGAVRSWRIPPMFAFHATQAFADGADLVLEISIYDDGHLVFDDLTLERRRQNLPLRALPRLVRYRLRDGSRDAEPEPLGVALELQQVHPDRLGRDRASVCWGSGVGPQGEFNDRTLRVDLDSGAVSTWQRPNAVQLEPLFVPRPGGSADDDGVLLVPTLADGDAASVIGVLDARSMACLAQLHAPQVIPFGFHAAFDAG